jgi:prepilin-type N-terminal cleavage/methylation domain-containing protein
MTMKRLSRQGFTLVELMIALTAGAFAVAGVYYLGNVSARAYNEQMRMSDAQMSLRAAMDQLRRDFSRAGYLGTRNANTDFSACAGDPNGTVASGATIQGVDVHANESMVGEVNNLLNSVVNHTRVDSVTLWGNYTTSDAYLTKEVTPTTLQFQTSLESFRRSFYDPAVGANPAAYNQQRFKAAFENQWIRVEWKRKFYFRRVTAVTEVDGSQQLTFSPALPGGVCFAPSMEEPAVVSPISRISYWVEAIDPAGELGRLSVGTQPGAERAVLVRREQAIDSGNPVLGTSRLVLDYAVEFAVDAVVNTAPDGSTPVFAVASPGGAVDLDSVSTGNPQNFRALRVTLSARTPEGNPRLPRVQRAALTDPFVAFKIGKGVPAGANLWAAVRTLRSEIFLPNMVSVPQ